MNGEELYCVWLVILYSKITDQCFCSLTELDSESEDVFSPCGFQAEVIEPLRYCAAVGILKRQFVTR